jgi:hypothetical protein
MFKYFYLTKTVPVQYTTLNSVLIWRARSTRVVRLTAGIFGTRHAGDRDNVVTDYVLMLDVDFIPSPDTQIHI